MKFDIEAFYLLSSVDKF